MFRRSCRLFTANAPANCQPTGLYGDTQLCSTGNYYSADADGNNRAFRFSCDTSAGHSGSALYTYLGANKETLAVTSVVSAQSCSQCTSAEGNYSPTVRARPNLGVRITQEYSGIMAGLKQSMP